MQRQTFFAGIFIFFLVMIFWYIIAYSFYDTQLDVKKDFVTDGCTMIPDGSLKECCVTHDEAYWQGGSQEMRKSADRELQTCTDDVKDNQFLAYIIYGGVRVGGVPYIKTPWRWGFGWEYGRGYR